MKALYLMGLAGSGKTAIALGIALKMKEEGVKVSYIKPFGIRESFNQSDDDDALLMKEILQIQYSLNTICPVYISSLYLPADSQKAGNETLAKIKNAFNEISQGSDLVLIDGGIAPYVYSSRQLNDFILAKELDANILQIIKIEDDFTLDEAMFYNNYAKVFGVNMFGNIFNNTERILRDKTKGIYKPILEKAGHPVIGIIPERPEIAAPTVNEFYKMLGGELLTNEQNMDRLVEDVIIGTMTLESALKYLRRALNKAVITGGDRNDIALAALETSTSVIILTGGLYPDVKVIARAKEKGVPILLVHMDTYTTIESLHTIYRTIRPEDKKAINIAKENIYKYCEYQTILDFVKSK